jgi:hypothetical protein
VLSLRFAYDAELIDVLKAALRQASYQLDRRNLGDWLAEHRCWFVERAAWPIVRRYLQARGYAYVASPEVDEPRPSGESPAGALPDVRNVIKSWYREMAKKFHPDRTLDNGVAMKAINHAYERLLALLGVTR